MKISFFGAAPDTGNLGVTALCYATLYNLSKLYPEIDVTVFDHGRGKRDATITFGRENFAFIRQGAVHSRRYYRPENLSMMMFFSKVGFPFNTGLKTISASDAVIDISGGDSFTDLYGANRFQTVALPKLIALETNRPLILLPQTYGPFKTRACREKATGIVNRATCAWARDKRSFEVLKDLLGDDFNPQIHRCGVDVAFGLPIIKPKDVMRSLLTALNSEREKVGINVSGLIYNDQERAQTDFGFKANYNTVVYELVKRFWCETHVNLLLFPPAISPKGGRVHR